MGEELEKVQIDPTQWGLKVIIGSKILDKLRGEVIEFFLKKTLDFIAWSHKDMVGIDLEVACYRLNLDPHRSSVAQKHRKFGPKKYVALPEEVKKLLDNDLIEPIDQP